MTRKLTTLLGSCLIVCSLLAPAQAEPYAFDYYQGPDEMVLPVNFFQQFHSHLTNTGDSGDRYTLTFTANDPENWSFNVCVGDICYQPTVLVIEIPAEPGATVAPGETVDLAYDVTSLFDEGPASYEIQIVSQNDASVAGTWTYDASTPAEGRALLFSSGETLLAGGVDELIAFHPVLYNAGTLEDTYTLTMTRNHPDLWSTTFCYDGVCYPPSFDTGLIPDGPGTIASGQAVPIDIDFTTLSEEGPGSVTVQIVSNSDPSLSAETTFTVSTSGLVSVGDTPAPTLVRDLRAAPNPFNPRTEIRFTVGGEIARNALVDIHDASGRRVRTLLARDLAPGMQSVTWDGLTDGGQTAGAGVYLARVRVGGEQAAIKISLVK
jgi:hypothetical protein